MKVIEKTIYNQDKEQKYEMMVQGMREIMSKVKNKDLVFINGQMAVNTKESDMIIKYLVKERTHELMVENTKEIGIYSYKQFR